MKIENKNPLSVILSTHLNNIFVTYGYSKIADVENALLGRNTHSPTFNIIRNLLATYGYETLDTHMAEIWRVSEVA